MSYYLCTYISEFQKYAVFYEKYNSIKKLLKIDSWLLWVKCD